MTRVDFHFNTADKLGYACRLLRKAYRSKARVWVCCRNEQQRKHLDQLLWTFSALEFIPHVDADHPLAARTPIVLADSLAGSEDWQVALHLGHALPPGFSSFERWIEIVGTDEEDRLHARTRWAHFREHGYPIQRFDQQEAADEMAARPGPTTAPAALA